MPDPYIDETVPKTWTGSTQGDRMWTSGGGGMPQQQGGFVTPGSRGGYNPLGGQQGAQGGMPVPQQFQGYDPNLFPADLTNYGYPGFQPVVGPQGISAWNSPQIAYGLLQSLESIAPGITANIPSGYPGFSENSRANFFNLLAGKYANDPAHLAGRNAGPIFGAAMNLTEQQAANMEQRQQFGQDYYGQMMAQLAGSPGVIGTRNLMTGLMQDPYTTSNDALQREIEGLTMRRLANAREGVLGELSAGQAAQGNLGGESSLLRAGADFGTRGAQADALAQLRVDQAQRRQADIMNAMAAQQMGQQTLAQSTLEPAAAYQQMLANRYNPYTNSLIEQMRNLGGLALDESLRDAFGSQQKLTNWFAGIGAVGNLLGAASGGGQ